MFHFCLRDPHGRQMDARVTMQLTSATILWIAAKFESNAPISADDIAFYTDGHITKHDMVREEFRLLIENDPQPALGWNLWYVTRQDWLEELLQVIDSPCCRVSKTCEFVLMLTLSLNHYFRKAPFGLAATTLHPIDVAVAVLRLSLMLMDIPNIWTAQIAEITMNDINSDRCSDAWNCVCSMHTDYLSGTVKIPSCQNARDSANTPASIWFNCSRQLLNRLERAYKELKRGNGK